MDSLPLVERLLRCELEAAHSHVADTIWDSSSDAEAMQQLEALAQQHLKDWEQQMKLSSRGDGTAAAEANMTVAG